MFCRAARLIAGGSDTGHRTQNAPLYSAVCIFSCVAINGLAFGHRRIGVPSGQNSLAELSQDDISVCTA
jgi:hypothetical protein